MVINWVTSGQIMARVVRNTRLSDDTYLEDIPDWIGEAILKLRTRYSLELKCKDLPVNMCQVKMPCGVESLAAVLYEGKRILPSVSDGPLVSTEKPKGTTSFDNAYQSILYAPCTPHNLDETSVNNWPEYVKSSSLVESCEVHPSIRYRVNYNKLEIGANYGTVTLYYWSIPKDDLGFPMIPDHEDYKTAIYWYVRSMMIGAGYPDKVFNFQYCDQKWEILANRAINDINYPTVDEVEESLILNNRLVDIGTGWSSFFTTASEGNYDDFR